MVAPNTVHQSGQSRAFVEHTPFNGVNRLFLTLDQYYVQFENGSLTLFPMPTEGTVMEASTAALVWSDMMEDSIIDVFKAICKALELYTDEPGQAYKQGYAEGQTAVYKEWNEHLRG